MEALYSRFRALDRSSKVGTPIAAQHHVCGMKPSQGAQC